MKQNIGILGVLLFAIILFLSSCGGKTENGSGTDSTGDDPEQPTSSTSYLALADLAFKGYLFENDAQIKDLQSLYVAAQKDTRDLISFVDAKNKAANEPLSKAGFFQNNQRLAVASLSVDLCLCPDSKNRGLCPCPGITSTVLLSADTSAIDSVQVEDSRGQTTPINAKDEGNMRTFEVPNLTNQTFTLVITGNLSGMGVRTYKVPMENINGKLFMR